MGSVLPTMGRTVNSRKRRAIVDYVTAEVVSFNISLGGYIAKIIDLSEHGFHYQVEFTGQHGQKIVVTSIWTDDDGNVLQYGTQSGNLTL